MPHYDPKNSDAARHFIDAFMNTGADQEEAEEVLNDTILRLQSKGYRGDSLEQALYFEAVPYEDM